MAKEEPFLPRADAERVRKKIAVTGEAALALLAAELAAIKRERDTLPESWVDKFRKVADQLRRDYRLDPADAPAAGDSASPPAVSRRPVDPLAGLKIVDDEAA